VTIAAKNNSGQGYAALSFNQSGGYVPPDTVGAAGPINYVETVNQTVAIYSPKSTGASSTTAALSTFWFTTGGLPRADSGSGLSDPIVIYDDAIGRFVVGDQDVDFNSHVSNFDIAASKSSSPSALDTANWNFYQIHTTESGFDADYPGNFGFNHDALVITLNMFGVFGGGHVQVISVNNADLANGVSQSSLHVYQNDLSDFSVRATTMHGSVAGDPMWLVTEHGDNTSIDVIKMTNVLSTLPTFTYTNLAVTPYSPIANPLNPNGTVITNNIDTRIMKAAEWNGVLVATHHVAVSSTQDVAQWYSINVSGTPSLLDQGRVSAGNNTYITYPSIDINSSGQIGMTYMKSGTDSSTDYMSMYVTGRTSSDPAGTMETSVLVPAGHGQANYSDFTGSGRAGDLGGINVDLSDGSFWAANEFANTQGTANWGTAVANFTISNPVSTTHLSVSPSVSSVTAGTAFSVTVTALTAGNAVDPTYRGTIHFTSSDSQATLPANYTFVAADGGVHTFTNGVTLVTAGSQSVTATDTTNGTIRGSGTISVNPAAASTLAVTGFPSPVTAGSAGTVTVTAKDPYGNTATGYTGTVHFTSSDGQAALPANSTLTNGTGSFSATLKTAGTQSLTATDPVTSSITGSQTGITVNPAAASTLTVAGFPSPVTAGTAGSFTVTAKDPYGNKATGYTGTVHFTSSDAQAVLPANSTLTNGTGSFSATLKTAGTQSLTATDSVTSSITGSQTGIVVNPAAASTLVVASFPSPVTAGTVGTFAVTAKDPYGNTATGYTGTVHFTSSDCQAALPANSTLTNGTGSFSATLKTAGTQSLTATDTVTSSITGSQLGITVNAAAADHLAIAAPASSTSGVAFSITVTAQDPFNNTATTYLGTVRFTSSDTSATLPGNYSFTAADNGAHTFANGVTLQSTGLQTVTATDTATSTITGTASVNVVAPAQATHLAVSAPGSTTAGAGFTITVTALDASNNTVPNYRGTIHFTSSDTHAGVVLPVDYTFVAADNGVHMFSSGVTLVSAGSQTVTATDTANSTITGSATVTVNPASASTFVVAGFPSPVTAGSAGTFTVTAKDTYGNTATGYSGTVHFTSSDGQAALPANSTLTNGTGSFSATLKTAGTQSLTATDLVTSTITGSQSGITVNPAAASTLTVTGFPSPVTAGTAGTFTVTAKDPYGNTATGYSGTVHFTSSDAQAALPANSMLTNGTGSFSATLKTAGTQSLTATDSVTSSITGSQTGITVNPAAASTLIVAGFPSPVTAGTAGSFTVTAKDPYGNTATGYTGTVHFTSSDNQASLPANSTLTNGAGSFSATLNTVGTQSITATDTVSSSITGTQSGITVNAALFVGHINFTNSTTDTDNYAGYTDDIGLAYGPRGGGLSFGWNQNNTANARDRNNPAAPDERYDTLSIMQEKSNPNASWKIAVPNGTYTVHLVAGDPSFVNGVFAMNVNGVLTVSGTPTSSNRWISGTVSITVSNGFITVTNASGSRNNKVDFIDITQTSAPAPLLSSKIGTDRPGGDVVQFTPDSSNRANRDGSPAPTALPAVIRSAATAFAMPVVSVGQEQTTANSTADPAMPVPDLFLEAQDVHQFLGPDVESLVPAIHGRQRSNPPADWFTDSWLTDSWLSFRLSDDGL
jgi:hypothetical protein